MNLPINHYAAVQNPRVLVELPAREVVAQTGIVLILTATLDQPDAATAKIVTERMSQPERFVFLRLPTRMKPADIIRDVASEESVLLSLNLLLQTLAVIRQRRSVRECETDTEQQDQRRGEKG